MRARSLGWLLVPIVLGSFAILRRPGPSERPVRGVEAATVPPPPAEVTAQLGDHEQGSPSLEKAEPLGLPPPLGLPSTADTPVPPKPLLSGAPPAVAAALVTRGSSPDPEARQRAEMRAAQATSLDSRLERRIAELRTRIGKANGSEQQALADDLTLLERNLARRRVREQEALGTAIRATDPGGTTGRTGRRD